MGKKKPLRRLTKSYVKDAVHVLERVFLKSFSKMGLRVGKYFRQLRRLGKNKEKHYDQNNFFNKSTAEKTIIPQLDTGL